MNDSVRRTAAGFMALVVLWICVYWWWPSEPRISFAQTDTAGDVAAPEPSPSRPAPAVKPAQTPAPAPERPREPAPQPTPQPKPPPVVQPPEFIEHTVERGETFGSISRRYFGSTRHADEIARANPFIDPSRLRPGRVIRVPKDPENIQGKPTPPPPAPVEPGTVAPGSVRYDTQRSYTVVAGDTLSRISQKMYGTQANTELIFEANRKLLNSPDDLSIGQVLVIPPATGPAPPPR